MTFWRNLRIVVTGFLDRSRSTRFGVYLTKSWISENSVILFPLAFRDVRACRCRSEWSDETLFSLIFSVWREFYHDVSLFIAKKKIVRPESTCSPRRIEVQSRYVDCRHSRFQERVIQVPQSLSICCMTNTRPSSWAVLGNRGATWCCYSGGITSSGLEFSIQWFPGHYRRDIMLPILELQGSVDIPARPLHLFTSLISLKFLELSWRDVMREQYSSSLSFLRRGIFDSFSICLIVSFMGGVVSAIMQVTGLFFWETQIRWIVHIHSVSHSHKESNYAIFSQPWETRD